MDTLGAVSMPLGGRLELSSGDLAALGPGDGCDLIVLSAFPGDYTPTAGSLIGALSRRGLGVAQFARDPEFDLRASTSCWLSRPIPGARGTFGFNRLLCYEPRTPAVAATAVGDVFRALVPFVGPPTGIRDVAMPLVASGYQARPREEMLSAILSAAEHWMSFGLPLDRLRVVIRETTPARPLVRVFESFAKAARVRRSGAPSRPLMPTGADAESSRRPAGGSLRRTDEIAVSEQRLSAGRGRTVFVSYARADGRDVVDEIRSHLSAVAPDLRTLIDVVDIDVGAYWQTRIAELIESSDKVLVIVTDGFWRSKNCLEEYNMALLLHKERPAGVLFPIYARSCQLPLHLRAINYVDCREADRVLLQKACNQLVSLLS
jgi:TIR domain